MFRGLCSEVTGTGRFQGGHDRRFEGRGHPRWSWDGRKDTGVEARQLRTRAEDKGLGEAAGSSYRSTGLPRRASPLDVVSLGEFSDFISQTGNFRSPVMFGRLESPLEIGARFSFSSFRAMIVQFGFKENLGLSKAP